MRLSTRIKLVAVATAVAFLAGYIVSRYGRLLREQWDLGRRRRQLNRDLATVLGEKARIEEELRQMEDN